MFLALLLTVCIILFFIGRRIFRLLTAYHYDWDEQDKSLSIMIGLIVLTWFVLSIIGAVLPDPEVKSTKHYLKLENLADNIASEGHFTLGFGSVEGTGYYFYYYKVGDGYKLGKTKASTVVIKYTDGIPCKVTEKSEYVNLSSYWLHFGGAIPEDKVWFEVPKGSIKTHYTLDAQ